MAIRYYPAIVEGDAKSGYSVFFPDLPGCTSGADTLQEAALNAERALDGHIALMIDGGERVPEASSLDDLPGRSSPMSSRFPGSWCGLTCARRSPHEVRPSGRDIPSGSLFAVTSVAPLCTAWAAISRS